MVLEIVVNYIMETRHTSEAAEGRQRYLSPEEASGNALHGRWIFGWFLMELCKSRGDGECVPGHVCMCKSRWGHL